MILTVARDTLRNISPVLAEIVFGAFLIVVIVFLPAGLVGALQARRRRAA